MLTPTEQTNSNTNFPSYDALENFPADTDFIVLIKNINALLTETKESQWTEHINAINDLRRLFKYHRNLFYRTFVDLNIKNSILKLLNSIRSILVKNTLVFLTELFTTYEFEYTNNDEQIELINIIELYLPKIIDKSYSDKKFIKDSAIQCLKQISTNMFYGKVIVVLLNECLDKNFKHVEVAFNVLIELINNFEKNYLIYYDKWESIFRGLSRIYQMKKECYIKKPGKIIECFQSVIGKETFDDILQKQIRNEDKPIIKEAIECYSNKVKNVSKDNGISTKEMIKISKQRYLNDKKQIN